jgi:hypothetical protein
MKRDSQPGVAGSGKLTMYWACSQGQVHLRQRRVTLLRHTLTLVP